MTGRAASPDRAVPAAAFVGTRAARFLYGAVALLYWAALFTYVPTLPAYAATLTPDLALVGAILSMYGLWQAIARLPVGIASDWLGRRKPFIILGLALCGAGALLMGSAAGPQALLFGRVITGLGAATWVPLTVVFSALYPAEHAVRATTILTLISAVARVLATAANGPMNALAGYGLAFTVAAALSVAAIFLVLPAPDQRRKAVTPSARSLLRLSKRRDVLLPGVLSAAAHYVLMGISYGFVALRAKDLGASSALISSLTVIHLAAFAPSTFLAAMLVKRYPVRPLLLFSFAITAAGVACAMGGSTAWLVAAQVLSGIGYGMGYPILLGMGIERVDNHERTTAMGLHQSMYAIGMFAGPWLSGILAVAFGMPAMFAITAAGALGIGIAGSLVATRNKGV